MKIKSTTKHWLRRRAVDGTRSRGEFSTQTFEFSHGTLTSVSTARQHVVEYRVEVREICGLLARHFSGPHSHTRLSNFNAAKKMSIEWKTLMFKHWFGSKKKSKKKWEFLKKKKISQKVAYGVKWKVFSLQSDLRRRLLFVHRNFPLIFLLRHTRSLENLPETLLKWAEGREGFRENSMFFFRCMLLEYPVENEWKMRKWFGTSGWSGSDLRAI